MSCTPSHTARPQDRPRVTLADIVRTESAALGAVFPQQARALAAIAACRTAALGGHRYACDSCGESVIAYNSCRNRHCPQCQSLAQARWVDRRQEDLLPVEYFHVVFTIPAQLHELFLNNQAVAYGHLFTAGAESLIALARDPRHIGARMGAMAVLHTWTQTLVYHPHIHMIVPGGGPSPDGTQWLCSRPGYLLPVRALSEMFRGKLLGALDRALASGHIVAPPGFDARRALRRAARKKWNVYSKPSFVGPEHVVRYLGRYTHRIAISNGRLLAHEDGEVSFRYTDRARDRSLTMTLPADQFLRRFLLHVLPPGFVRIRYFGGLAHATRQRWLSLCRKLLAATGVPRPPPPPAAPPETWQEEMLRLSGIDVTRCPKCKTGRLVIVERFEPRRTVRLPPVRAAPT